MGLPSYGELANAFLTNFMKKIDKQATILRPPPAKPSLSHYGVWDEVSQTVS